MNIQKQKIYTGNFIRTFDTMLLVAFFIFCCYMVFVCVELGNNRYWFGYLVWLALFGILTNKMNYFILNEKTLIAKNPIWFWREIIIDLDNIANISVIQPTKSPISLDIKTNSQRKIIGATSLRNYTWKELISDLEKKGISITLKIKWE